MESTVNGPAGVVLACYLALLAVPAGAAGEILDEKAIASSLSGVTLDGVYADGGFFSETYATGGDITYRDRNGKADGNWSINDGMFCTFYENQQGACFFVRRDGDNCFAFIEPKIGPNGTKLPRDQWTSRGWNRATPSSCLVDRKDSI
jgi:hypothetical protein